MEITFLEGARPLTKQFNIDPETKEIVKGSYPHILNFTSHTSTIDSLAELHTAVIQHSALGHCLLKGEIQKPLVDQSRAGSTSPLTPTSWVCLDIDGLPIESPEELIDHIPELRNVSYILQLSSSQGIDIDRGYSAHLFFKLAKPLVPSQLKDYLTHLNLDIPLLEASIQLSPTGAALTWPLDITTCQNDKLLYIAPPELGKGIKDPHLKNRISLIKKKKEAATIDLSKLDHNLIRSRSALRLNDLRKAVGMKARQFSTRMVNDVEILSKPGTSHVTTFREERGFVYLNLNGGDSYGYYHPTANPEILYNFKGEPNYLTRELVPEYYSTAHTAIQPYADKPDEERLLERLAFLDPQSDGYYRGTYEPTEGRLDLLPVGNLTKLQDFLKAHKQPVPDFIPEIDYQFMPNETFLYDRQGKRLNMYVPTEYQKIAANPKAKMPPTIHKLLMSVVGGDEECYHHLVNWIAVVFKYRVQTQTMWVLSGTQGTGKGVLINYVLAPLIGHDYVVTKSLMDLEEQFNGYMERCLLLFVDEASIENVKDLPKVIARIKNFSVEPTISIRKMRSNHYMANNHMNIVFASNKPNPIEIDAGDRRFNVGVYQPDMINLSQDEFNSIGLELEEFAGYLHAYDADVSLARKALDNEAKEKLCYLTRTSMDVVADAIRLGNLEWLVDALPTDDGISDVTPQLLYYKQVLMECVLDMKQNKITKLSRDQLRVIFEYNLGKVPSSPNKFTAMLKYHDMNMKRIRKDGRLVQGMEVEWKGCDVEVDTATRTFTTPLLKSVKSA